ncbi:hypothetical protein MKW98_013766 [Papaver atlanticum]|uniref:Glabrous enhancer-binding protein-like DBD domain-containing protein n=1 Tax=Papaver atlanticum TaxID=357466 RepID=A0AAD4TDF1_9MAGN|nr:hypothetical protein MKW98_013766 [Papaver atlanticum]
MSSIKEEDLIIKYEEQQRQQEEQEPEQIGEDGDEEDEEPEEDGESEDLTISNLEATIATPIASAPPLNGTSYQTPPQPQPQQTPATAVMGTGTAKSIISTSSGDESRKLFQRLWTDEDEIGLLQGFLDFNTQRGTLNSSYHHETGPFYDHIKNRLNLDFNKSQLVEKLRRLKKKYRNVVARVNSGKDFNFKTPHDQTTFEISRKIWSGSHNCSNIVDETLVIMEDDNNNNNNNNNNNESTGNAEIKPNVCVNGNDDKVPRGVMGGVSSTLLRKRGVKRPAEEELMKTCGNKDMESNSVSSVIEETVKSCLTSLFKELINCVMNGQSNAGFFGFNGMGLNPLGAAGKDEVIDEKWRKQQILELEVYSKRVELVQEQIKSALEDLKSTGT